MFKKLKELWLRIDAWFIMRKVNSDPSVRGVKAPEEIREKLFRQIREYEENREK